MAPRTRQRNGRRQPNLELYAHRINRGLSREDLARMSGVSRESIRLAEAGWVPGPRIQFALATVFELKPMDLWPIERQRAMAA